MKRYLALSLALAVCLSLAACQRESAQPGSPQPSETMGLTFPADPQPTDEALTSPPELEVATLYRADFVTAAKGNFSWRSEASEGLWRDVIACGASPLDDGVEWPLLYTAFGPGVLPPPEEGELVSSILPVYYLEFDSVPPDTVTARRWSVDYIGQNDAFDKAEEVAVEWVEVWDTKGRVPYGLERLVDMAWGCYALHPLGDGEFVYEVDAKWDDFGNAEYIFQTLPQVRGEKESAN